MSTSSSKLKLQKKLCGLKVKASSLTTYASTENSPIILTKRGMAIGQMTNLEPTILNRFKALSRSVDLELTQKWSHRLDDSTSLMTMIMTSKYLVHLQVYLNTRKDNGIPTWCVRWKVFQELRPSKLLQPLEVTSLNSKTASCSKSLCKRSKCSQIKAYRASRLNPQTSH